jgi:putative transposase
MSVIHQAYKFALDPTPEQERAFHSHVGASRYVYNYLLGCMKATRDQRKAEISFGVAESELTPYFPTSHYALRKIWNTQKDIVAP